jgi:hypothetical protein
MVRHLRRLRAECGQAAPLAAAAVALAVTLTVAVARLAGDLADAARARTAADAAALAAVYGGRAAAAELAARHDGTLIEWFRVGRDVVVTVRFGHAVATARATGGELGGRSG